MNNDKYYLLIFFEMYQLRIWSHVHGNMGVLKPGGGHLVVIENDDLFDRALFVNSS